VGKTKSGKSHREGTEGSQRKSFERGGRKGGKKILTTFNFLLTRTGEKGGEGERSLLTGRKKRNHKKKRINNPPPSEETVICGRVAWEKGGLGRHYK